MAAHASISPPEKFNFQRPEEWSKWIKRFDRYITVAGITEDTVKINTLIYAMGPQAEDILLSLNLTEQEAIVYNTVKQRFDRHFIIRHNVIFERARFNRRVQREGESIETFITDLYALIEHCNYGEMKEELLRDRIVVGINDTKLSQSLQLDTQLTLEGALARVRSKEMIEKQTTALNDIASSHADAVRGKRRFSRPNARSKPKRGNDAASAKHCPRCGNDPHAWEDCPARKSKCRKCGKIGHWEQVCRSKQSNVKEVVEDSDEKSFLGTVCINEVQDPDWDINLSINEKQITFKIDCGADVTVVSKADYKRVASSTPLSKPDKILMGANSMPLKVLGVFDCVLVSKNSDKTKQRIYVVDKFKRALLGKPAITSLNILQRTNAISIDHVDKFKEKVMRKFPELFKGLGNIEGEYHINLNPEAKPVSINAQRRVAQPLLPKVKECLEKMVKNGVVRKLDPNEVSEWCSGMVVVPKTDGSVRICVDLTELNKHIIRPRYALPTVDETLAKLGTGAVFTKLDANSGFFQCNLSHESQVLTSFLTPWGRFCYMKVPFGITSGPEYFQDKINGILDNSPNTNCLVDDICIFSENRESHEKYLFPVLQKLRDAGVTLNVEKCEFMKDSITFVGHKVSKEGISADARKVKAINEMPTPQDTTDLRRFLGMVNQLGKFSNKLAEHSEPLRALLSKKNAWVWGHQQDVAFAIIKAEISSPRVLAKYEPTHDTKIRSDSSNHGYGAVLLQRATPQSEYRPVYFASKALSPAEQRYSIIEKEAGAIAWACSKFDQFILGMDNLLIETDQKPLVALLGKKSLDNLPPRIVRFRLALMRYKYTIQHVPGKYMYTSDCLSRASIEDTQPSPLHDKVTDYVNAVLTNLPCTDKRLEQIKQLQHDDEICIKIVEYTRDGWPEKTNIHSVLMPYYQFQDEFSVHNGLLLKSERIVIPTALRLEILDLIHQGHLGIEKCRSRALQSVWWPGLSKQIEQMVKNCMTCARSQPDHAEPLMTTPLPDRPWQRIAVDSCEIRGAIFLVAVNYYSRYIEMARLDKDTKCDRVIIHMKSIMARHGIPETVVSDNGPQFNSHQFARFSAEYGFTHIKSSPRYARSNGAAENAVKRFKALMQKNKDPYLALLTYRATPIHNGYSPAELCIGRKLRTTLPVAPHTLKPKCEPLNIREREERYKEKMTENYNARHLARDLPILKPGDKVIVRDRDKEGSPSTVITPADNAPRSFVVQSPKSTPIRRNRRSLIKLPTPDNIIHNTTRSGRVSRAPERLNTPEINPCT